MHGHGCRFGYYVLIFCNNGSTGMFSVPATIFMSAPWQLHEDYLMLVLSNYELFLVLSNQYELFLVDNKNGAKTKPWTPPDLDLGDCSKCKKDKYCGQPITINIDLKNVFIITIMSKFSSFFFLAYDGGIKCIWWEFL